MLFTGPVRFTGGVRCRCPPPQATNTKTSATPVSPAAARFDRARFMHESSAQAVARVKAQTRGSRPRRSRRAVPPGRTKCRVLTYCTYGVRTRGRRIGSAACAVPDPSKEKQETRPCCGRVSRPIPLTPEEGSRGHLDNPAPAVGETATAMRGRNLKTVEAVAQVCPVVSRGCSGSRC